MLRLNILRPIIQYTPIATVIVGIAAAVALGWFCYQYVYRAITTAQATSALQPPLAVELIDPQRVDAADAFFRTTDALPPIDPATIHDVFRSPNATAPTPRLPTVGRPSR
jgi:hypothetical protein